jgi:hypothetical protein
LEEEEMKNKWMLNFIFFSIPILGILALVLSIGAIYSAINIREWTKPNTRKIGFYEDLLGGFGQSIDAIRKMDEVDEDTVDHRGEIIFISKPYGYGAWNIDFYHYDSATTVELKATKKNE